MHACDNTNKVDLNGTGCKDLDWFHAAQEKAHWAGSCRYANKLLSSV
jgi:hypothetical protein